MDEEKEEVIEEEKKEEKKEKHGLLKHLKGIGCTNRLALYLIFSLFLGLLGGFYLAKESIKANYMGALACWTVVFTPIGTALSVVLGKIVEKSKAENTVGGIKYELAVGEQEKEQETLNSPPI